MRTLLNVSIIQKKLSFFGSLKSLNLCFCHFLKDLRDKGVIQEAKLTRYRENDPGKIVLRPIKDEKDQTRDYALDSRYRAPRYMIGYTGIN